MVDLQSFPGFKFEMFGLVDEVDVVDVQLEVVLENSWPIVGLFL
jgi:hypothetical protein